MRNVFAFAVAMTLATIWFASALASSVSNQAAEPAHKDQVMVTRLFHGGGPVSSGPVDPEIQPMLPFVEPESTPPPREDVP